MHGLHKMKVRDGPYLVKAHVVAEELSITGEEDEVKDAKIKFLDELHEQLDSPLEKTEMINNLAGCSADPKPVLFRHSDFSWRPCGVPVSRTIQFRST